MSNLIIYALLLESNKFYIGKTSRIEGVNLRFHEHLTGRGSEWTKKFKPISIIESYDCDSSFEEDVLTKKYMMTYGIQNVRGGSYTKIELEDWQVMSLDHEFKSVSDKCFKCGKSGHFANECGKRIYSEYTSKFKTEEELDNEINHMENIRSKVSQAKNQISFVKYLTIIINKSLSRKSTEIEEITIEIEPSIIDKYNMRDLKWNPNSGYNRNVQEINSEIICSHIYSISKNININIHIGNIAETIYKIYIHRRRLEREYLDLVNDLICEDKMNFDEILKEVNKKLELLYEKLASLI